MASAKALDALRKAEDAIKEIQMQVKPFMALAEKEIATARQRAQAQAAIALSLGTLRYMGARLRGLDQGRRKEDPLRQELDHMRKLLVSLQRKQSEEEEKQKKRDEIISKVQKCDESPKKRKETPQTSDIDKRAKQSRRSDRKL